MARDEAVLDASDSAETGANYLHPVSTVDRRTYLKLAGTGVIGAGATGVVGADDASTRSNVVTVVGNGTPSSFELTVDGTIESTVENPAEEAIVVSGTTVEGAVGDDAVAFPFDGHLTDVTILGGDADVHLNDEPVDPVAFDAE